MECPRCKVVMVNEEVKGNNYTLRIEYCQSCEGSWLKRDEMAKLEAIVEPVTWEVRKIPKEIDQLVGLYCPSCTEAPLLNKADHHRDRRVVIDYCTTCHGTWLDKGELTAIQQENFLISIYQLFRDLHKG